MLSADQQADFGKEKTIHKVKKLNRKKKSPAHLTPCSHRLSVASLNYSSRVVFLINVSQGAKYKLTYVFLVKLC